LRRTFCEGQSPTADLPLLVVGDHWGSNLRNRSGQSSGLASTFKSKIEAFASTAPPAHAALFGSSNHPIVSARPINHDHLSSVKSVSIEKQQVIISILQ
jgi:hypothetical protein